MFQNPWIDEVLSEHATPASIRWFWERVVPALPEQQRSFAAAVISQHPNSPDDIRHEARRIAESVYGA